MCADGRLHREVLVNVWSVNPPHPAVWPAHFDCFNLGLTAKPEVGG